MIEINNVTKIYKMKENEVKALDSVNLSFSNTGLVVLLGPSGSGKTTLLNILGGIDSVTEGNISYNGSIINNINVCEYRRNICSFVFQEYNLLSNLNVRDNISLITDCNNKDKEKLVSDILEKIGLSGYEKRNINELSGGQKQRIAIGRALAKGSKVLLCDEPTGNLDSKCSEEIFELLKKISKEKLVIVVSHNEEMANKYASRIISIKDGSINNDKLLLEHDSDISNNNSIVKNKITLNAMLKYGIRSIKAKKFKTIISILLLIISLFSVCMMVMFSTYSSEKANAWLSKNNTIEYLVMNSGSNSINALKKKELPNIESIISNENRMDGYEIQNSIFYIVNSNNKEILDNYSFYFKEDLTIGSCYITDYYLDIVINKEYNYNHIMYSKYEDVKNQPVYFNNKLQFIIAGIIETDYHRFYNKYGYPIKTDVICNYETDYANEISHKLNYEYKILFGYEETFNNMDLGRSVFNYSNENKDIQVNYSDINNKNKFISKLDMNFIDSNTRYEFYLNNGYYGSFLNENDYTKKIELEKDEIIISFNLYNQLYNLELDYNNFDNQYYEAIRNGKPYEGVFDHIGDFISIRIIDKNSNEIINLNNLKIVGVGLCSKNRIDYDYEVYLKKDGIDNSNLDISSCFVSALNWENISNKLQVLNEVRENNIILSKAIYMYLYSIEPYFNTLFIVFAITSIILLFIVNIVIINFINNIINDNKKEIGILCSLGINRKEINIIYSVLILFMICISFVFTLFGVYFGCYLVNCLFYRESFGYIEMFYINYRVILIMILVAFITLLCSLIPVNLYCSRSPIDIIR